MLAKSTFFILLTSFIAASSAIPVPQAADATPSASASVDPANLDPLPESSSVGDFGVASVPTTSSVAPLPSSTFVPPKHEPTPIPPKHEPTPIHHEPPKHETPVYHTTSTLHHVPVHTPVYEWQPPVHHTTTLQHIPVHTPVWYPPPVHYTTPSHHVPVHTPVYYEPPVHHTTTFHHIPDYTPTHHVAPPVHTPVHVPVHVPTHHSFDRWGGYDSLKDFDHFYGVDNWDGYKFEQVFVKEHELVCKTHEIHVIQQRLLVLQEMAKRIIVETICEVEVQTIVFEQWYASLHGFGRDLRRFPGNHHQVGYDQEIVKHFPKFIKVEDGSLNLDDWHFTGKDLGKHTVVVKGHNWDDKTSPSTVWKAWGAARKGWFDLYGKWF
ncbi:hypothetical protein BKA70DRAFT_1198821 [Coprinopsis sp. MPI-PUGE-AT-0042]|nr:hypothetical protein BKA70DRAFT_1198821 [Coprinopsis sp. MPI-PUGE-AT-0042]